MQIQIERDIRAKPKRLMGRKHSHSVHLAQEPGTPHPEPHPSSILSAPKRPLILEISLTSVLETAGFSLEAVATHAPGPSGLLPLTPEMLLTEPSGNLFGLSQNAGMGWDPARLLDPEFLILSTHGGLRAEDGNPIALGFHTGHWEVGSLVAEAARELKSLHAVPFAGACTDPSL